MNDTEEALLFIARAVAARCMQLGIDEDTAAVAGLAAYQVQAFVDSLDDDGNRNAYSLLENWLAAEATGR